MRAFNLDIGTRRPLGVGAGGLAILSAMPNDQIREAIKANGNRFAAYDGLTVRQLMRMVRTAQARGFAVHDGSTSNARAIGVPIYDLQGSAIAAISVSAHVQRMPESCWPKLVALLRSKAETVEQAWGSLRA